MVASPHFSRTARLFSLPRGQNNAVLPLGAEESAPLRGCLSQQKRLWTAFAVIATTIFVRIVYSNGHE
jgi:hypothetical protein